MFYREVKRSESSVLGYKGGYFEEDLLGRLSIPYLNLECFGCPKAEKLMKEMVWLETCGNHTLPDAYAHCAKLEVEAYAYWLEKNNELLLNNNIPTPRLRLSFLQSFLCEICYSTETFYAVTL